MQTVASCVRCLKVYLTVLAHVKMKTIKNHLHCNVLNAFSGHNLYNFLWSGRELRMYHSYILYLPSSTSERCLGFTTAHLQL